MQRHQQIVSAAAALLFWVVPASAAPPEPDGEIADATSDANSVPAPATWILVDARNHASGTNGPAAVVFGVAQERGRSRQASLRVDCFDDRTTLHIDDTASLRLGTSAVTVMYRLDGGPFVSATWQASADGSGLELTADRAVAFLTGLYGKTELRLAILRPLSVPFVFTFSVGGAEQGLAAIAERCRWSAGPAVSEAGR
jgi:Type VI secretion system VasI, EvfG, VC_A0118